MALRGRPEPDLSVCSRRRRLLHRYPAAEIRSNPDFHKAGFCGNAKPRWVAPQEKKSSCPCFPAIFAGKWRQELFFFGAPSAHRLHMRHHHYLERRSTTWKTRISPPTPKSNRSAKRSSSPASSRPAAHSPWATTWARSKTGARCRTSTTAPTASSTSTPSLSARTRRSSRPTPSRPTR